jgi:hypothetical protein
MSIVKIAQEVIANRPDAKPLVKSKMLWTVLTISAGWVVSNASAYYVLEQSLGVTAAVAIFGFSAMVYGVLTNMRRRGIKVPPWIADIAKQVIAAGDQKKIPL